MSKLFTHFIGAQLCTIIHTADRIAIMIATGTMITIVILVGIMVIDVILTIVIITGVAGKTNCGATAQ